MPVKSTNRLRLESLENRWNMSTIEPLALAAPAPEPETAATSSVVKVFLCPSDASYPSSAVESAIVAEPTDPVHAPGGDQQEYMTIKFTDSLNVSDLTGSETGGESAGGNARFPAAFNNKGTTGCVGETLVGIDFRPQ